MARPETFDAYQKLGEHYAGIRRWSPAFLAAFEFESVPAAASLHARDRGAARGESLRELHPAEIRANRIRPATLGALRAAGREIDRRHYELCVLSELRDRLRAGDVWVAGSRQYRSFEERLISKETLQELQQTGTLPVAVETDFDEFIESRRALLDKRLAMVDARAKDGLLPDVTIDKGVLKIAPIEKSTPPEAEALAARLYAMLPRVRVTDLLAEVAGWTQFPECFTHLRTGEIAADNRDPHGGTAGGRAQSRSDAHGRGLQYRQSRTARLDVRLAYPRRNLCPGVAVPGQPTTAGALRGHVRRWHRFVVRWPVLPGGRSRP